jgi:inorganic pyrophosphatase
MPQEFWAALDGLVATRRVVVDRPKGTPHPRSTDCIYPLDYGYLDGTRASDGAGVDVGVGDDGAARLVGVVCTVDSLKLEVELKLLLGCSSEEIARIRAFFGQLQMACCVLLRPVGR